jgi:threonine/homoserine/homoserine lactone efflux protein
MEFTPRVSPLGRLGGAVPDLYLPFIGLIVLLTITPGPDMLLVLRNGLRGGSPVAWATGLGCCSGIAIHAVAATLGLSALIAASAEAFTVLKIAGALYLIWLGASAIASTLGSRRDSATRLSELARSGGLGGEVDRRTAYRQGLMSNLLNPKIAVLFVTLLPQFVASGEPRAETTAILAVTFVAIGLLWMRILSLLIGPVARLLRRSAVGTWVERVTGALLVGIGVGVALEQR